MKKRIQTVRHAIESLLRHTCLLAAVPGLLFLPGWIWASDSPYLPRHGVNLATGNKFYQQRDLLISGPHDFAFSRSYNSQSREAGIFGYGWTSTLSDHLEFEGSVAWRCQADGLRMRLVSQGSDRKAHV